MAVYDPAICVACKEAAVWWSGTGHGFCATHYEIFDDLYGQPSEEDGQSQVDLRALMSGERPEEEWCVAPMLPAGKLCGVVSKRGEGKSILLLEVAAAKACGSPTLLEPASDPIDVVYIDMEMGPDDLYERLADLGYLPTHPAFETLVKRLHYYQLVALPPLDTEKGGEALEEIVERHGATLVVIDTVTRVISGPENEAEPFRDLFRHTESRLKRQKVTVARLDHLGKDKERGSRGSSAKEDALDVVWHLNVTATGAIELILTKGRQGWLPRSVLIHRTDQAGIMTHRVFEETPPDWLEEIIAEIDELGLPADTSANKAYLALQEAGKGRRRSQVLQVLRVRRNRSSGSGTTPPSGTQEPLWEPPEKTLIKPRGTTREPPGTGVVPTVPPPKGGYQGEPDTFSPLDDDFEPDPADLPDPF